MTNFQNEDPTLEVMKRVRKEQKKVAKAKRERNRRIFEWLVILNFLIILVNIYTTIVTNRYQSETIRILSKRIDYAREDIDSLKRQLRYQPRTPQWYSYPEATVERLPPWTP